MKNIRIPLLLTCLFALVAMSTPAQAQHPFAPNMRGGGIGVLGFNFRGAASPYTLGQVPVPPYFALHPPVYYSQPVARTYGYSPYAYPGSVMTPEVEVPKAAMITNPFVKPVKENQSHGKYSVSEPRVISNPYVSDAELVGQLD